MQSMTTAPADVHLATWTVESVLKPTVRSVRATEWCQSDLADDLYEVAFEVVTNDGERAQGVYLINRAGEFKGQMR